MIVVYDRAKLIAEVDLVDGEMRVVSFVGWVGDFLEELRGDGMTDAELFDSLPERLRGHISAGKRFDE